ARGFIRGTFKCDPAGTGFILACPFFCNNSASTIGSVNITNCQAVIFTNGSANTWSTATTFETYIGTNAATSANCTTVSCGNLPFADASLTDTGTSLDGRLVSM